MNAKSKYWENAWDEAVRKSPVRVKPGNEAAWAGYWEEVADEYLHDIIAEEPVYRSILSYLTDLSVFLPGDRVLDISCGPGTYALLFAEQSRSVDALDPSLAMLSALTAEAARRNLTGISAVAAGWEKFSSDGRYELVFSALSPAIRDSAALRKMESCSARSCCLITFGQAPQYGPRNDLWDLIVGERPATSASHYSYPYNVLREWDRNPELEIFDLVREKYVPVEQLIRQYATYFRIFTEVDAEKKRLIREYLEERSEGGLFQVQNRAKIAVISWQLRR